MASGEAGASLGDAPGTPVLFGVAVRAERRSREARPELIGAPGPAPAVVMMLHEG